MRESVCVCVFVFTVCVYLCVCVCVCVCLCIYVSTFGQRGALNKLIIIFTAALLNTSLFLQLRISVHLHAVFLCGVVSWRLYRGETVHSFDLTEEKN